MPVNRAASEYSARDIETIREMKINGETSKSENKAARSKIYAKLLRDPLALAAIIPTLINGSAPIIANLIFSYMLQYIKDFVNNGVPLGPKLNDIMIYMAILLIVTTIASFLQSFLWIRVGARMSVWVRDEVMTSLMHSDVTFFDRNSIGNILTILGEDSAVIQECFGPKKGLQLRNGSQYFIGVILCFVYTWQLGLVMVLMFPILGLIMLAFQKPMDKAYDTRFSYVSKSMTIAEETIANVRTVRGFNRQAKDKERFDNDTNLGTKYDKKAIMYFNWLLMAVYVVMFGGCDAAMYWAATLVDSGSMDVASFFSAIGFLYFGCYAVIPFEQTMQAEERAIQAGARVMRLSGYQPSINFEGGLQPEEFKGHIEFKNVTFKYPTRDALALNNVSFEVKPGEMAALVGHSGSGKSTCVQLLERFYDVNDGLVLIDGNDIRDLDPRWLHRHVGLVGQEPTLFQGTVRYNVLYGLDHPEEKTDDDVWAALEMANAKKFIQKTEKQLDTIVGDRGSTLSGGQRQRIAIARAIMKDPVVMITDEATSALDASSEKKVQAALDKILASKTSVVVAHRLSTVRNAHLIHVFHDGKIVEEGTHEELVAKGGAYYSLVRRQLNDEERKKGENAVDDKKKK